MRIQEERNLTDSVDTDCETQCLNNVMANNTVYAFLPVGLSNPGCAGAERLICHPEPATATQMEMTQTHYVQIDGSQIRQQQRKAPQPICQSYWRLTVSRQLST